MNLETEGDESYITVIAYCAHSGKICDEMILRKLCFYYDQTFDHAVDEKSLAKFLLHVELFGATIFPDRPNLGCFAIDRSPAEGAIPVSEIRYKGQVVYCKER